MVREGYKSWTLARIAQSLKPGKTMILKGLCRLGRDGGEAPPVNLAILRLASGELLALAASSTLRHAFARYRDRWRIDSLFRQLKTRGFNLEVEPLRRYHADPAKLSTLLALLTIAVALSAKAGVAAQHLHPIPIKTHGRKAHSLFAARLHALRKIFATARRKSSHCLPGKTILPPNYPSTH